MALIDELISEVTSKLSAENIERRESGVPELPLYGIKILGQMSLLMDPDASKLLPLAMTVDLDALLTGSRQESYLRTILKEILNKRGLDYDDLSSEIWLPSDAIFIKYFENHLLIVERLDPISALTSKAIKAPEKNKELLRHALGVYGEPLKQKILQHGGSLDLFNRRTKTKL